ncbi:hypothetical protein D4764_15G0005040, partial [Takifugu flavidus]
MSGASFGFTPSFLYKNEVKTEPSEVPEAPDTEAPEEQEATAPPAGEEPAAPAEEEEEKSEEEEVKPTTAPSTEEELEPTVAPSDEVMEETEAPPAVGRFIFIITTMARSIFIISKLIIKMIFISKLIIMKTFMMMMIKMIFIIIKIVFITIRIIFIILILIILYQSILHSVSNKRECFPLKVPEEPSSIQEAELDEENMPIPSVIIEPASSNEGDDDRDGDIISPTAASDNDVTTVSQTMKHMSPSGGVSRLPDDF